MTVVIVASALTACGSDGPTEHTVAILRNVPASLQPGDMVQATIEDADAHDLFGVVA